jgi:hypothetical protein
MTYLSDIITGIYPFTHPLGWVNPSDNITEICHGLLNTPLVESISSEQETDFHQNLIVRTTSIITSYSFSKMLRETIIC